MECGVRSDNRTRAWWALPGLRRWRADDEGGPRRGVQMWLRHHSPAFTLGTYVHLLPDDLPDAGFLDPLTRRDMAEPSHPAVEEPQPLFAEYASTA